MIPDFFKKRGRPHAGLPPFVDEFSVILPSPLRQEDAKSWSGFLRYGPRYRWHPVTDFLIRIVFFLKRVIKIKDLLKIAVLLLVSGFVQLSMKLEMKDSPGQLVAALKPISDVGGNIIAVIHQREPGSGHGTLDVQIVLELPEGRLEKLVGLLKDQGVHIQRIGEQRLLYTRTVILIGHLMHTDLSDTVDQIDSTGFAEVSELAMSMPAVKERSSSRLTIKSVTRDDMEPALAILRRVAQQKSLLLIEPLEDIA